MRDWTSWAQTELLLFENYPLPSSMLSSKNNSRYSKKCKKTNKYGCLNEIIWLMAIKMRLKMKKISHRYDINRSRSRHEHKYTKYKICLIIIVVMCT